MVEYMWPELLQCLIGLGKDILYNNNMLRDVWCAMILNACNKANTYELKLCDRRCTRMKIEIRVLLVLRIIASG